MYIVDDPTLALITRFVGDMSHPEVSDADFFHQQVAAIEAYVERFPPHERDPGPMARPRCAGSGSCLPAQWGSGRRAGRDAVSRLPTLRGG